MAKALFPGLPALTGERPWLAARGSLGLAFALAGLGWRVGAEAVLEGARGFARSVFNHYESVQLFWLEARVLSRLGKLDAAGPLLASVRSKLLSERLFPEAVLASFDTALVLAESGQAARIEALAAELEDVFAGEPLLDRAVEDFRSLRWRDPGKRAERVELTALTLRKHLRRRGVAVKPLPFA